MTDIFFDSKPIEAKLVFDCKALWATSFEVGKDFVEFIFSLFELIGYQVEDAVVKSMVSEKDGCHSAQDVVIVADKFVAALVWCCKALKVVIVHYCISEQL